MTRSPNPFPRDRAADLLPGGAAPAAPSLPTSRVPREGAALLSMRMPLDLSDQAATLLAVVAAHDRISPAEFITRAVCARADEIGIAYLASPGPTAGTTHNTQPKSGPGGHADEVPSRCLGPP